MVSKIQISDVFKKQIKILAYLLVSGVLGYVLAVYVANDKMLTAVFAPVINYILYTIKMEVFDKEGISSVLFKGDK